MLRVFNFVLQQTIFCLASNSLHFKSESGMPSATSEELKHFSSLRDHRCVSSFPLRSRSQDRIRHAEDVLEDGTVRNTRRQGAASDCYARLSPWRKRGGRRAGEEHKCQPPVQIYESFSHAYGESWRQSRPLEGIRVSAIIIRWLESAHGKWGPGRTVVGNCGSGWLNK